MTLDLTINNSYEDVVDTLYRCLGDSALLAGSYQTVSGLYVDTLQSVTGCDSIVTTELILDTPVYSTTDLELCYGDSAMFGGVMYDTSGVYTDTLQAQAGCDSVSIFNLIIKDLNIGDTTSLIACDSVDWNGIIYMLSGLYVDTLQSAAGCDSIITLDLTINNSYLEDTIVLTACDSTTWGGTTYTTSGMYNDTLVSASGCDSVITLDLTINGSNASDTTVLTACDSTVWNATTYTTTGIYRDTLQSVAGCDSIITLDLTIVSPVTSNVDSTICYGDSALLGGIYQSVSGSYNDTIVGGASNTCDSIVVTALTVLPENVGDTTVLTACDSTVWGGMTYSTTGLYNDTLVSASSLIISLSHGGSKTIFTFEVLTP